MQGESSHELLQADFGALADKSPPRIVHACTATNSSVQVMHAIVFYHGPE